MSADAQDTHASRPDSSVTPEVFREWRSPRFGSSNPERLNNPLWEWLIESQWSAYAVRQHFDSESEQRSEPGWSFARFGQSSTALPDGRTVLIAGEHEDSYDSDFYIYNDVVVRHPNGALDIFGYPRDVFPPTDFHSATLVGDRIVTIGSLGYPADRRSDLTPVVMLDLATFEVSHVGTGGNAPGWIHRHTATLSSDGRSVIISDGKLVRSAVGAQEFVENADDWQFDIEAQHWTRLTERRWSQFSVSRADRRPNRLWQMHSAWTLRGGRWAVDHRESMEAMIRGQLEQLTAEYGVAPDLDFFGTLYRPEISHETLPDVADEYGTRRIRVDDIVVRYIEAPHAVQIVVEGDLSADVIDALVSDLQGKLSRIENTAYVVRKL